MTLDKNGGNARDLSKFDSVGLDLVIGVNVRLWLRVVMRKLGFRGRLQSLG